MWSILILTLPSQPNAVRVRIWRALKTLGCAALRDGAYLLPADRADLFIPLAAEVREHGGTAQVMALSPKDAAQRDEVHALFDRTEAYVEWRETARTLRSALASLGETEARRRCRSVSEALQVLLAIDYYPGAAADQAQSELEDLRQTLDACFSKSEPRSEPDQNIALLDIGKFQGRRWATRARPWVDRLACAWLIRRFIDREAQFVWTKKPELDNRKPGNISVKTQTPRGALGFDFDGARFTHVGGRVTYEVLLVSFGLDQDSRLQRIAGSVHYLDAGGIPTPEAAGLEMVLGGMREMYADDDELVAACAAVFDAMYAAPQGAAGVST